jgi:hypothetical protein
MLLREDPTLLASGGEDGDFHIVYGRLKKNHLSLGGERAVTTRLRKDHHYAFYVFL